MNCDWTRDNIVLYIYEELPDDAKFALERHVQHCVTCRKELESARGFKDNMAALPVEEISPNLLTSCRMELQEGLEHAHQSRTWGRFVFDVAGWMQQIKLAPALATALLMIGFAGGTITAYNVLPRGKGPIGVEGPQAPAVANIAGIDSVASQENSNQVTIKYETLTPQTYSGDINDPNIRNLLLLATRNTRNDAVTLETIDILKAKPEDSAVREALIYALRYDRNPGVRLKALGGLKSYVKDDVHVRDAVLEALMHDSNAGVRAEAIGLLDPVKADSSVRDTLLVLAERDQNKYIRSESKRILGSTPNLD